jgi:D-alanyl-lipoteichoic acid acyltransferase DltB (MBOAT superfamily)
LSYVIDIYKGRIKAEKNLIDYSVFVSFFPLLVAGPIERATHLLPQIQRERKFNYTKAVDGMRQILWGLFKKIVIADNCAQHADLIFNNSGDYSGFTLFLGALFFTFQIYGDFSGYSDIALGTARLFGVELLRNFAFPYFSRDIAEFWRRWHISLSTWFRDYLYIPLGGSKGGTWIKVRNTFIIFIVSGFWHGANWTFIAWGLLNALFIMPSIIFNTNRDNLEIVSKGKYIPTLSDVTKITITFCMTVFAWIFFRAESITHAFQIISSMFSGFLQNSTLVEAKVFVDEQVGYTLPIVIILFFVIEWVGRESQFALADLGLSWSKKYRIAFYYVLILLIFFLGGSKQGFIYFQF